jgi:hypothetical protein
VEFNVPLNERLGYLGCAAGSTPGSRRIEETSIAYTVPLEHDRRGPRSLWSETKTTMFTRVVTSGLSSAADSRPLPTEQGACWA